MRRRRVVSRMPEQWQVSFAGMAAVGVTFGFARYGYGLFLPELRHAFGLSLSLVGVIASASYVGYVGALLLVGALVTRLGPRPLVVIGGLSAAGGMALVACAHEPVTLTAGLVLAGTSPGWVWAPYSDAVDRILAPDQRERAMGTIATGTAFAVALAGPLTLTGRGGHWRQVWLAFAAAALMTTFYNAWVLPGGGRAQPATATGNGASGQATHPTAVVTAVHSPSATSRPPLRAWRPSDLGWLGRLEALPLYTTAFSYGLVGAVYWAFAAETLSDHVGTSSAATRPLFWTLIGLAGTAGILTGHAITRCGLRRVHSGLFAGLAIAAALLTAPRLPGALLPASVLSALLYGPCIMAGAGVLAVWSYRVFPDRPAPGFTATVLAIGLGTITGPVLSGQIAQHLGLQVAFATTAIAAALTTLAPPTRLRDSSSPSPGSH